MAIMQTGDCWDCGRIMRVVNPTAESVWLCDRCSVSRSVEHDIFVDAIEKSFFAHPQSLLARIWRFFQ